MKITKELFMILADAYVKTYKRGDLFYDIGRKTGVYVDFDGDPQTIAIEKALEILTDDDMLIEMLCKFAENGSVEMQTPDAGIKICFTLEAIWDTMEEWDNE